MREGTVHLGDRFRNHVTGGIVMDPTPAGPHYRRDHMFPFTSLCRTYVGRKQSFSALFMRDIDILHLKNTSQSSTKVEAGGKGEVAIHQRLRFSPRRVSIILRAILKFFVVMIQKI